MFCWFERFWVKGIRKSGGFPGRIVAVAHLDMGSGYAVGMAHGICKVVSGSNRHVTNVMGWRSLAFFCLWVKER